jgi:hypothetical protein
MTTTIKSDLIILAASLIIAIIVFVFTYPDNHLHYRTFQAKTGWGYEILSGENVIIHQKEIPALAVARGFEKKSHAEAIAQLVIKKIKNGEPPSIGIFELTTVVHEMDISK